VVVFYTDGLVDARQGREEYGPERLQRGLEAHAALAAPKLGEQLLADLEGFLGDQSPADDVTLIVVKVI
jgi:serine phosphatase RsbU (regulator of sigma subunit)